MQKGNQAPLALASATTSSLPTTSQDFRFTDNFTVLFWKEAALRISTKTFSSTTQLPLSVLSQGQKQKHSLWKAYAEHQYNMFWWVHRSEHHLQRVEFESGAEHTALKCGKWRVLSWWARTGKRLTYCIKIHLKMLQENSLHFQSL